MHLRTLLLSCLCVTAMISVASGQDKPRFAGPTAEGFLLPNGWTISPVGEQVALTDLPLNIVALADSKYALVGCSGYNPHVLSLVDLQTKQIVSKFSPTNSWFGLAVAPGEEKIWWSGAGENVLHTLELKDHKLTKLEQPGSAPPSPANAGRRRRDGGQSHFRSGICLDVAGKTL